MSLAACTIAAAQPGILRGRGIPQMGRGGSGQDSLKHRTNSEDSITINYHYLDSVRTYTLDSSISDFTKRFPIPATYTYLGNTGTAAKSLLFNPALRIGWDPGFHALDIYKWNLENVRFYNTTRPFTELGYSVGSKNEQFIEVSHTQNIRPYWNISFRYRSIYSSGFFKSQKANHNNYLVTSWYQSPKKRYNNYFILLDNSLQSAESGGIKNDENYLKDPVFKDRFNIPTNIGGDEPFGSNFFSSKLSTGNRYTELNFYMRQQYDLGKKDSIVTDSTVIPLFYPRLRFEHTFKWGKYSYNYIDLASADSPYYSNYNFHKQDSINIIDKWTELSNDFSIYQFPDAKNLRQFIKAGINYQVLSGAFKNGTKTFYNVMGHGEYRNKTRNQKWDLEAFGSLYLNGYNAGDYNGTISLQRFISPKIGTLQVGFQNVNRSPSFIYDARSSFYLDSVVKKFGKENTIHLYATAWQPALKLQLSADYYLASNYLYLTDFYKLQQETALFNILRINALKTFSAGKYWHWYSEVYLQQKTGSAQVHFPLFVTRNRFAFEGLFYKNLNLSTGIEVRYHSPYKADNYSPVLGQFFYQDSLQISNQPDVAAFLHFRIRSFKAYIRAENLNALGLLGSGKNNTAAPGYPYPGLMIRFGFYWGFVN